MKKIAINKTLTHEKGRGLSLRNASVRRKDSIQKATGFSLPRSRAINAVTKSSTLTVKQRLKYIFNFLNYQFRPILKAREHCPKKDVPNVLITMLIISESNTAAFIIGVCQIMKDDPDFPTIVRPDRYDTLKYFKKITRVKNYLKKWIKANILNDLYYKGSQGKNSYQYFLDTFYASELEQKEDIVNINFSIKQ